MKKHNAKEMTGRDSETRGTGRWLLASAIGVMFCLATISAEPALAGDKNKKTARQRAAPRTVQVEKARVKKTARPVQTKRNEAARSRSTNERNSAARSNSRSRDDRTRINVRTVQRSAQSLPQNIERDRTATRSRQVQPSRTPHAFSRDRDRDDRREHRSTDTKYDRRFEQKYRGSSSGGHYEPQHRDKHRGRDRDIDIDIDFHFGSNRWGHYKRPYCPPPRRPRIVYTRPVVYCPPPIVRHVVIHREVYCPPVFKTYVECNGWDLLARGYAGKALYEFQRQATAYPYAGLPRVGIALAEAMLHDHDGAIHAMRRAFREDPGAMKHIPVSEGLDYQLRELIEVYEYKLAHNPYHNGYHYMISAISYFRHDYARAQHELAYIMTDADHGIAAENLERLIYEAEYGG